MKYIVLLGDGMPDYPLPDHDNKTPLQIAKTPNMDFLAKNGITGGIKSIPDGFPPGSDVSNLSIFGYNPEIYYTGRSPLEAASMGIDLKPGDIAFRCNLVTLKPVVNDLIMEDYSAGHISTEEAKELINFLNSKLGDDNFSFYPGVSYRHLLVWHDGKEGLDLPPPHDLSGKGVKDVLSSRCNEIIELLNSSQMILKNHPVNLKRVGEGKKPANSIWLWGSGKKPAMPDLKKMFDLEGAVISAVDLLKGIGIYAGLDAVKVKGATGYIDTNYKGKVDSALKVLEERNFV
ncbi:MAG: 2,3-bisphosphoglycerate-independent phosphoglycerate mutase, partial [Nitrospinota bacterium]|nr:2,3-bisphosphoglycerate-independent phosphoglycerate mutase [Nitrospinota bacterium]